MSESEPPHPQESFCAKERKISEALLQFLQSKLDSLSIQERQSLSIKVKTTADEAMRHINKKLLQRSDVILRDPKEFLSIELDFYPAEEAFQSMNYSTIEWGRANRESKTIFLLLLIGLAPKEVIRTVIVHEVLHIVHGHLDPKCIVYVQAPPDIELDLSLYPMDLRQEECWVRTMTKQLGINEMLLPLWEMAIEQGGENWRPIYYGLKRN